MKKKWSLFLLISLLVILSALLAASFWVRPKEILNESIGTQYTFQDIQFDMISTDFEVLEEAYEEFVKLGQENVIVYENSSGGRMVVMNSGEPSFFHEEMKFFTNPVYIVYLSIFKPKEIAKYSDMAEELNNDFIKYKVTTHYSDEKEIVYKFSRDSENLVIHSLDILLNEKFYTIILTGDNLTGDAKEIIRSVNLK